MMFLGNTPRKQTPKTKVDCRGSTTCSFFNVIPLIHSKRFQKLALLSANFQEHPSGTCWPTNVDDCNPSNPKCPTFINSPLLVYAYLSSPSCYSKSPQVATKNPMKKLEKPKILDESPRPFLRAWARYVWPLKKQGGAKRGENLQFWRYTVIFKVMTLCWKFNHHCL